MAYENVPVRAIAHPDPRVATRPTHRSSCLCKQNSPSSVVQARIVCTASVVRLLGSIDMVRGEIPGRREIEENRETDRQMEREIHRERERDRRRERKKERERER